MALGSDNSQLQLAQGDAKRGVWTTPENIGVSTTRFRNYFTGSVFGTIKRGTFNLMLNKTYVEAKVFTPAELFAKDVIDAPFTIEAEILEMGGDHMATFFNRDSQLGYAVTVPSAETWDLIHIGSDVPPIDSAGYLFPTVDRNDREFEMAVYAGLATPEGQSITLDGDNYAVVQIKFEATRPSSITNRKRGYGYLAKRVA